VVEKCLRCYNICFFLLLPLLWLIFEQIPLEFHPWTDCDTFLPHISLIQWALLLMTDNFFIQLMTNKIPSHIIQTVYIISKPPISSVFSHMVLLGTIRASGHMIMIMIMAQCSRVICSRVICSYSIFCRCVWLQINAVWWYTSQII